MGDQGPIPVSRRLYVAGYGATSQAYGPTETQRMSLEIAESQSAESYSALEDLVNGEFNALQEALEQADVPWTPGRGLPLLD